MPRSGPARRFCRSGRRLRAVILPLVTVCSLPALLHAQSLEPRLLSPAPIGMNFLVAGYVYSSGNMILDDALPLEDTKARAHSLTVVYVRSINLFGQSGRVSAILPFADGRWTAEIDGRDSSTVRTGLSDPMVSIGVGLYGAPAMRAAEFATFRPRTMVGAGLRVRLPLGQYDDTKLFNLSTHRWQFIPSVGAAQYVGRWVLEAHLRAWFSTTNNDFFGGNSVAQDPLFGFQLHAEYIFGPGFWGAVSFGQSYGGATTVDGVKQDNRQSNNRFGLTLAVPLYRVWALKGGYYTGISTRYGGDFDTFALALQYRWGGMK